MEKITNVTALETAIETLAAIEGYDTEIIEKLTNIKNSYAKKSSSPKKPTQTQLDNERIKERILDIIGEQPDFLFTVTDIVKALGDDYSNQKISALCTALYKSNLIDKVAEKRKSYYTSVKA